MFIAQSGYHKQDVTFVLQRFCPGVDASVNAFGDNYASIANIVVHNPAVNWPYVIPNIDCGTSFQCAGPEQQFDFGEGEHKDIEINKFGSTLLLSATRNGDTDDFKEWTLELKTAPHACYRQSQDCSADWRAKICNA